MDPDSLHRLVKVLADGGEVPTLEDAQAAFARYGVRIVIDAGVADDEAAQIIALTAINAAARSFIGNVAVETDHDFALRTHGFDRWSLGDFTRWAGVQSQARADTQSWPVIRIAPARAGDGCGLGLRPWAAGWRFGVGKLPDGRGDCFAPACVAAGGLAVSEAFSLLRLDNPYAGRRSIALSLGAGSELPVLSTAGPFAWWLVGLGHLGQAFAWTLGLMRAPSGSTLYLQDIDTVTPSTWSTSMISTRQDIGLRKTRVVAHWLEARGYTTALIERRLDANQRLGSGEPRLALFGVDNAAARRGMESVGFDRVLDVGLGSGHRDFRAIRIRSFPGPSSAAALWATDHDASVTLAPAYRDMLTRGADPCGVTTLASRAVGAPFVGCVAAGFALAELLRTSGGQAPHAVIDMNLRDPAAVEMVRATG
jgi:hypothetical protein